MNKYSMNDDIIECVFYSSDKQTDWEETCKDINILIDSLASEYFWHKEKFKVELPFSPEQDQPKHLISNTCFGDNIEDEWYIVHLALEITKKFSNLVVQVRDGDGEFLLIEAANHLPKWTKPENMENRVFIYQNAVHIIPPQLSEINANISIQKSIQLITENADKTLASDLIQSAIMDRIGNANDYKEKLHVAVARVPIEVAALLKLKPFLISYIVNAYCNHDVIDARQCKDLTYETQNCVEVKVTFTKVLYAMLLHSKLMRTKASAALNKDDKRSVVGYKLACGLKIIMSALTKDTTHKRNFQTFFKNLKDNGYFKENIEGSKEYNSLLDKAKEYYETTVSSSDTHIAKTISELLTTNEYVKQIESLKCCPDSIDDIDENEDWLSIEPQKLNEMLNDRFGKKIKMEDDVTPETLSKELSKFLYQSSDLEGIETNDDRASDVIQFDENEFVDSLEKMLKMITSDNPDEEISSDDDLDNLSDVDEVCEDIDQEVKSSLASDILGQDKNKKTLDNLMQSLKAEKGYAGPSSLLLKNIGINKNDLLDSDDDMPD